MARKRPSDDPLPRDFADEPTDYPGHDVRTLGPSDSSDSGSDLIGSGLIDDDQLSLDRGTNEDSEAGRLGELDDGRSIGDRGLDNNSDRYGTGERADAAKEGAAPLDADILPDRIVGPEEAGLGGGLDQAEEAQLGITDEQIEAEVARRLGLD